MSTEPERLQVSCKACGLSLDVPNKGLGRAMLGVWDSQHSGHDEESS